MHFTDKKQNKTKNTECPVFKTPPNTPT